MPSWRAWRVFQRSLAPTPSDIHFPDYGYFLVAVSNVWNVRDLSETVLIAAVWGTSGPPVAGLAETTGRNVWRNPALFSNLLVVVLPTIFYGSMLCKPGLLNDEER